MDAKMNAELPLKHPAGLWFVAFMSALMCVGFGAINSQLVLYAHQHCTSKQQNFTPYPRPITKFTLSLLIMGAGILLIPLAIYLTGIDFKINLFWIVLLYIFLAFAELLIGPISQSMVGRLSPEGMEGAFMGSWQLFTGFAGAFSVYLDKLATAPQKILLSASNTIYTDAFLKIGGMTVAVGIISMLMIRYIRRLIAQ